MPWGTLRTSTGAEYADWVKPVPGIPHAVVNSVVYLYVDQVAAETGHSSGGSGFLLGMPSEVKNFCHIYAITNAHVVESGSTVVRINLEYPSSGYRETENFDFTADSWVLHTRHDLAVRPFPPHANFAVLQAGILDVSHLILKDQYDTGYLNLGDELVYIGRFVRHGGGFRNVPSVRFGNLSALPDENDPVEYEIGGKHRSQVAFLVEARSRSGYSGSPVFLINELNITNPRGRRRVLQMKFGELQILGVDCCHLLEDVTIVPENRVVQINSGMMGVVPSWYLEEFLRTSPDLIEQRRRDDDYYRSRKTNAVAD
jgi:hypothetical protein